VRAPPLTIQPSPTCSTSCCCDSLRRRGNGGWTTRWECHRHPLQHSHTHIPQPHTPPFVCRHSITHNTSPPVLGALRSDHPSCCYHIGSTSLAVVMLLCTFRQLPCCYSLAGRHRAVIHSLAATTVSGALHGAPLALYHPQDGREPRPRQRAWSGVGAWTRCIAL